MVQGIDQNAGNIILAIIDKMKQESNGEAYVTLHAAIPYPGQESVWPRPAQDKYDIMLDRIADQGEGEYIHYVHPEKPKTKWEAVKWLDERNHYMVD